MCEGARFRNPDGMGQLVRGLEWAGDWECGRAYGGRGMAGYKNLEWGRGLGVGGDSLAWA